VSDEWGPWIEHDGGGCPVAANVTAQCFAWKFGTEVGPFTGVVVGGPDSSWFWRKCPLRRYVCYNPNAAPIIRYRVRKPRALMDLIKMVENMPVQVDA
jgi:hypothetical protein